MFITLKYGNNASMLLNPNCCVIHLIDAVKNKCLGGDTSRQIDFTDEIGNLYDLSTAKNFDNAKLLFANGPDTYVLVEKAPRARYLSLSSVKDLQEKGLLYTNAVSAYFPLLNDVHEHYPNYKIQIKPLNSKETPPTIRKKHRIKSRMMSVSSLSSSFGSRRRRATIAK